MVQSARVQEIVKGDDVVLTHQIMEDVAFNAELSRAPVLVNTLDIATFFYPLGQPYPGPPFNPPPILPPPPFCNPQADLVGYVGVPTTAYPASIFTVAIPGTIISPNPSISQRGTSTFQSGLGRTVRAEILRFQTTQVGSVAVGIGTITGLASVAGLKVGQQVIGPGIQVVAQGTPATFIESIDPIGLTVTLTSLAIATEVGQTYSFYTKESHYSIDEVDVFERGFPNSLTDTSGGLLPPQPSLNLT